MRASVKHLSLAVLLAAVLIFCGAEKAEATTQYINAIVPVSITIASGQTTGTQAIASPTGTYFMLYGGMQTTATTSSAQGSCYLTWSGTTVTATRQTSSTNTTTCNGTMVDATSNLVTSVQHGTIAISSGTSNTATISSVTTADSSVNLLGWSMSNATFVFSVNHPILTLTSATVVTAKVAALTTGATAAYQVVNWNHAALNQSTQPFNVTWTNTATSTTQTITSVNVNNAILLYAGDYNNNCCSYAADQQYAEITAPTTVTISTTIAEGDAGNQYAGTVVEFISGVLSQANQRGTTVIAAGTASKTSTITSAATSATAFNFTGYSTLTEALTSLAAILPSCSQTSATVVTCTMGANVPASKSTTVAWETPTFQISSTPPATQCVPTGSHQAGLIYPIYVDPPNVMYSDLITNMASNPKVPVIAILNPASGPGTSQQAIYVTAIAQLKAAGAIVLGYVPTGTGIANHDFNPQNQTTIEAEVTTWISFYPNINGIFYDEYDDTGSATTCTAVSGGNCITLYQNLTAFVHSSGLPLVFGNPGDGSVSTYFSSSPVTQDRLMIFETNAYPTAGDANDGGLCSYYNCASVAYNVSYSSTVLTTMMQNSAWVFMTDGPSANPYDVEPTYLATEMAAINTFNTGGGTSCPMVQGFP